MTGFHDLFSKRGESPPDVFVYDPLPQRFRVQVIHLLRQSLLLSIDESSIAKIVDTICEEHGLFCIDGRDRSVNSCRKQVQECIEKHKDSLLVLDLIELSMRKMPRIRVDLDFEGIRLFGEDAASTIYKKLNIRFRENGLGYEYNSDAGRIIKVSSSLLHASATTPSLSILSHPKLSAANKEFLAAYDDYKKGNFNDCVVKSCAAFESTLKVVCAENGWSFDPNKDTCGKLVDIVVQNGRLDSFLMEPLKLIGSIRNKKSSAHGGGSVVRDVSESLARYCLNATASSILYVVESTL